MQSKSSWASVPPLPALPEKPDPEPRCCCLDAYRLYAFGQQTFARLSTLPDNPTSLQVEKAVAQINDARLKFLDRYISIRSSAPQSHKDKLRNKEGEPCLHAVFLAWYERFLTYLHEIKPPPLAQPTKPPTAASSQQQKVQKAILGFPGGLLESDPNG